MTTYNTNMAAEFYVLSMLHRLGADASLTLGNKKAVDILVVRDAGKALTIDVKGVAGRFDRPADNIRLPSPKNHFFVLVSFEGRIEDPKGSPSVWVIPASRLKPFIIEYRVRTVISRAKVKKRGTQYFHSWWRVVGRGRV